MSEFVHLHVHSRYSLLDGAIRLPDLFARCEDFSMESVAITDHGTMHGAMEFYLQARQADVNPIIGCEFYFVPSHLRKKRDDSSQRFHLTLLAMDYTGYQNLVKLATIAQTKGFFHVPCIDKEVLTAHNEGVICLSGCLSGEVPSLILENDYPAARARAVEYREIFDDRYYLEIQNHGLEVEESANAGLIEISEELGVPIVATNDCHYLNREDVHAHEVLLCIRTNRKLSDPERFCFPNNNFYFKSPKEMAELFSNHPETLTNSVEIASRCNLEIPLGRKLYPSSQVSSMHFVEKCRKGLEDRIRQRHGLVSAQELVGYRDRLDREIQAIVNKGWVEHILIIADYVNWAWARGIRVGPGRGSAICSLVNFVLGVTEIDPVQHELYFERYLNDERPLPEVSVDFAHDRRDEVVDYIMDKYSQDRAACIVAFSIMKGGPLLRDIGRVLEISRERVVGIVKQLPLYGRQSLGILLEANKSLQREVDNDPAVAELFDIAKKLEGLIVHASDHTAAVTISQEPLVEHLSLCRKKDGRLRTQYEIGDIEKVGIPCFHLLGWKPLTVIDHTVRLVKNTKQADFDVDDIPMDDTPTFKLLRSGNTGGIYQFDWDGLRELLLILAPVSFQELCDLQALYRPGPLDVGMVSDYVNSKHGHRRNPSPYPPEVEAVLERTCGVLLYQEQVMVISKVVAGYPMDQSFGFYKVLARNVVDAVEKEREKFMAGAKGMGFDNKETERIFDLLLKYASYTFNQAHAVAYGLVAYQCAYLKANYPAHYMAAALTCNLDNSDTIESYVRECGRLGIELLPVNINVSEYDCVLEGNSSIRLGLGMTNISGTDIQTILQERRDNGLYKSFRNFCERIDLEVISNRCLSCLGEAGAFDNLMAKLS